MCVCLGCLGTGHQPCRCLAAHVLSHSLLHLRLNTCRRRGQTAKRNTSRAECGVDCGARPLHLCTTLTPPPSCIHETRHVTVSSQCACVGGVSEIAMLGSTRVCFFLLLLLPCARPPVLLFLLLSLSLARAYALSLPHSLPRSQHSPMHLHI